jgi:hypothetical protein
MSAPESPLPSPVQAAQPLKAPEGTDPNTVWIWILVALPVLGYLPLLFIPWQYFGSMFADLSDPGTMLRAEFAILSSPAYLGSLVLSFLIYAGTVVLALLDFRALTDRGVPKPFHWALSFIPSYGSLVYIIGRSVVVHGRTGRGLGPLWLTIGLFVASVVASFALLFVVMNAMFGAMDGYNFR